jgi:hypothetical protein
LETNFKEIPDIIIWFDIFSNNQHLTPNLPFEWFTTTYKSAIQECGHTVMVLAPWNDPIQFTRAWCLFDIYCTVVTGSKLEIAMIDCEKENFLEAMRTDAGAFDQMLANIDLRKSEAWNLDDKARIFEVAEKEVGFDRLNAIVLNLMRDWGDSVKVQNAKDECWERRLPWMVANAPYLQGERRTEAPIQMVYDTHGLFEFITTYV